MSKPMPQESLAHSAAVAEPAPRDPLAAAHSPMTTAAKAQETHSSALAVRARALRKSYGQGSDLVQALAGVDVEIQSGEIVGVLGPNGAGKTTLISILEGLLVADSGSAYVLNEDVSSAHGMARIKPRLGVSMQNSVLPPLLRVEELLQFKHAIYPNSRDPQQLLTALGLASKAKAQYRHLSGGQQQRVVMAMALMGDPELLFLDEPTSQLDPQARRVVWELLLEQRARRNSAMLVTTHQMEEAERLCDRVLILDHGRVIAEGSPRELVARYCPARVVEFSTTIEADLSAFDHEVIGGRDRDGLQPVRLRHAQVDVLLSELMGRQSRSELVVEELRITAQTLEDVFIHLTGRGIRE